MTGSADGSSRSMNGILVTGGAGYIGSHVLLKLVAAGETVIVLDNLATGFESSVLGSELVTGDIRDPDLVTKLLQDRSIETVMHFAASTVVPDSVADPLAYYSNNAGGTLTLLRACASAGVRYFIFSSTAAVYGIPDDGRARETDIPAPINPYGASKLMAERMLEDMEWLGMRHVILRYFNVAGSDPDGRIGQSTREATLLIKAACEAALGKRNGISIYGTDYETPDGTGVRDYIHVDDLARAHIAALDYLRNGGQSEVLNCGYGRGYSVREVLDAVARTNGAALAIREEARRSGDPAALVAVADRVREVLGWQPKLDKLDAIVGSSLNWERKLSSQCD